MSEFLAEASVLIRPDTTAFRAKLEAELTAIIASAKVPPVVVPVATTALGAKGATAATTAATVAAEEQNAVLRQQGAISAQVSAQTAELARATQLQAKAESVLAGATEVASLKTTELAKARSVLATTSRAVTISERAVAAAVASEDAPLIAATGKTLALARAQELAAKSAVKESIALNASAAAAEKSASAHALAARGAGATGLSLLGARGATLAASSSFLIGAAAVTILAKSIKEASDETEELNKTAVVFGRSAKEVQEFAETTASSLGISRTEALKATGVFGNLFRTIKISTPVAADMSTQLVRLASDLASFNNADPTRTLDALRSGLVGQARPLRVFGIFLSAARVQEEALRETGKKRASDLSEAEKVQARFNLILRDSALAQGDFARTSDRAANQVRVLKANLSDLAASLGGAVIPTLTLAVQDVNDLVAAFKQLEKVKFPSFTPLGQFQRLADKSGKDGIFGKLFLATPLGAVLHPLDSVNQKLALLGKGLRLIPGVAQPAASDIDKVTKSVNDLLAAGRKTGGVAGINEILTGLDQLVAGLKDAGPVGELFAEQLQALRNEIARTGEIPANFNLRAILRWVNLEQEIEARMAEIRGVIARLAKGQTIEVPLNLSTKIDVAEAQGQDTLPLLQQQLKKREAFLARLLAAPLGTFSQDLIDQAAQNVTATKNQIKSIVAQQAAGTKDAADEISSGREKATQAFIDSFSAGEQKRQNAITNAGLSTGLQDDINTNKKLITFFKSEIDAIKKRIHAMNLHGDALKIAQAAIAAINQKIFSARNEIAKLTTDQATNRAQALQAAQDARQTHLEAMLSIAETTPRTGDDRGALQKLINFDIQQIARLKNIRHRTQEQNAQLDAYRVDLAQRTKALRDIIGEKKKADNAFNELTFDFLQKQQGFAANLLGNLIPGGATAGLVGGGAGPLSTLQGPTSPAQGVQTAAAISGSRDNPLTRGDVQTELHLLRSILNVLRDGNSKGDHPEAWFNRRVSGAAMDTFGV